MYSHYLTLNPKGVVAPPRKLFPNWTKVSLRTMHDWRIKLKRANEKRSSQQVLHFPIPNLSSHKQRQLQLMLYLLKHIAVSIPKRKKLRHFERMFFVAMGKKISHMYV